MKGFAGVLFIQNLATQFLIRIAELNLSIVQEEPVSTNCDSIDSLDTVCPDALNRM
jgi:hypothetical protein